VFIYCTAQDTARKFRKNVFEVIYQKVNVDKDVPLHATEALGGEEL
jgi:hypothetical protein